MISHIFRAGSITMQDAAALNELVRMINRLKFTAAPPLFVQDGAGGVCYGTQATDTDTSSSITVDSVSGVAITINNVTTIEIDQTTGVQLTNDSGAAKLGCFAATRTQNGVVTTGNDVWGGTKEVASGNNNQNNVKIDPTGSIGGGSSIILDAGQPDRITIQKGANGSDTVTYLGISGKSFLGGNTVAYAISEDGATFSVGVTGTFANPTSITVTGGIITAIH